jgi:hypothetical protein
MTAAVATHLDLDDSRVVRIRRDPGRVTIELEQARSGAIKCVTVTVTGVTLEDAAHYVGHNVTAPHPCPESPLDYIEHAEYRPGELEVSGYLNSTSWFVWRLVATGVDVAEHRSQAVAAYISLVQPSGDS